MAAAVTHIPTIAILGDSGVGKTAYIQRLTTGHFSRSYTPTLSSTIHTCSAGFTLENGMPFTFRLIDVDSSELALGSYGNIDAAIIMFDFTALSTYTNLTHWYDIVREEYPTIPIVLVGNKAESLDSYQVSRLDVRFHRQHPDIKYYDLSVKACYQFDKPINYISHSLIL